MAKDSARDAASGNGKIVEVGDIQCVAQCLWKEIVLTISMDRGGADLMMKLLTLDPVKRLTADEALDHAWFWTSPKPAVISK